MAPSAVAATDPHPTEPWATAARPGGFGTSFLLAGLALVLFLLLPQKTLHGVDSNQFAVWIEEGHYDYPRHIGYLHLVGLLHEVLARCGQPGGFLALRLTAAIGTALGVFATHRAARTLAEPRTAAFVGLAVLLTPAWFFYGGCAEIPGVFAAGCGLAWWTFARWLARPTVARAAALGAGVASAGALHAFGHVLSPAFVAIVLLWRRVPARGRWLHLAAWAGVHATIAVLLPKLLGAGASGQANDAVGHLEERWRTFAPWTAPAVTWREWFLPYAPWSVLSLLALLLPGRKWAVAVLVLLALHLPLNVLLLGFHEIDEDGAYLIALALPAVFASLQVIPARAAWPLVVVAVLFGVRVAAPGWVDATPPDFAPGIAELQQERPMALVVAGQGEIDSARASVPGLMVVTLAETIGAFVQTRRPDQDFGVWFDAWAAVLAGQGLRVVLADSTRQYFLGTDDVPLRRFWAEHLPDHYTLTELRRRGFVGVAIAPK